MNNLTQLKPLIFGAIFFICILLETFFPIFKREYKKRLVTNFVIFLSTIVVMKFCFPYGIYALSLKASTFSKGLNFFELVPGVEFILTILIFDFAIYWQHRVFHRVKFLWKYHAVHHCDTAMDFSNALRFHPGEIVLSGAFKLVIIMLIVPKIETFFIYELILVGMALFNHSNFLIPKKLDTFLRFFIVTPNMHYPHHSPEKYLTNSNYGNFLSIWDKLFKTYTIDSNKIFGLRSISKEKAISIKEQLLLPFNYQRIKEKTESK